MSYLNDSTNKINDIFVFFSPSINELMRPQLPLTACMGFFCFKCETFGFKISNQESRALNQMSIETCYVIIIIVFVVGLQLFQSVRRSHCVINFDLFSLVSNETTDFNLISFKIFFFFLTFFFFFYLLHRFQVHNIVARMKKTSMLHQTIQTAINRSPHMRTTTNRSKTMMMLMAQMHDVSSVNVSAEILTSE